MNIVHDKHNKTIITEVENIASFSMRDVFRKVEEIGGCYDTVRIVEKEYDFIGAPSGKRN